MAFFTLKGPAEWEKDRFGRLWTELFVIFPAEILVLWCFIMFYYIYIYIWVNYISPTWIQAILGIIPLTNYDYSEVAVRSLLFTHIYIYHCSPIWWTNWGPTLHQPFSGPCRKTPISSRWDSKHQSKPGWLVDGWLEKALLYDALPSGKLT